MDPSTRQRDDPPRRSPWPARGAWFGAALALGLGCWAAASELNQEAFAIRFAEDDPTPAASREQLVTALSGAPFVAAALVIFWRIRRGRSIHAVSFVLGSLFAPVLWIGWMVVGEQAFDRIWHARDFESAAWIEADEDVVTHRSARLDMVDGLISSGRLMGLTYEQLLALLGPPAPRDFPFGATACDLHWYLGPERGFLSIDSEWLFVTFDDEGHVDRTWLYTD